MRRFNFMFQGPIFPTVAAVTGSCGLACAATVDVGALATTYADLSPPWSSSISASSTVTVDLGDLAGLTPGADIVITFGSIHPIFWTGAWRAGTGPLTLTYDASLTLAVGTWQVSSSPPWPPLGPVDFDETFSPVVGYEVGPVPNSFTLTVPWGTDLSAATVTLTDRFTLTGTGTGIENSSLSLDAFSLSTVSAVPEPSAAIFCLLSTSALLRRKRNHRM